VNLMVRHDNSRWLWRHLSDDLPKD
jgi:hypothetical protein